MSFSTCVAPACLDAQVHPACYKLCFCAGKMKSRFPGIAITIGQCECEWIWEAALPPFITLRICPTSSDHQTFVASFATKMPVTTRGNSHKKSASKKHPYNVGCVTDELTIQAKERHDANMSAKHKKTARNKTPLSELKLQQKASNKALEKIKIETPAPPASIGAFFRGFLSSTTLFTMYMVSPSPPPPHLPIPCPFFSTINQSPIRL